jgi:hypothetical protein
MFLGLKSNNPLLIKNHTVINSAEDNAMGFSNHFCILYNINKSNEYIPEINYIKDLELTDK